MEKKPEWLKVRYNQDAVNEVAESPFKPSLPQQVERFVEILSKKGINATVRRKLGSDIDASCGQLRLKENKVRNKGG